MTDHIENKDPFTTIMTSSTLELPDIDFDNLVMHRIVFEKPIKTIASRDRKFSLVFLALGTLLGLLINIFANYIPLVSPGKSKETVMLIFQLSLVFVVLLQLDKNMHVLRQWREEGNR